MTYLVEGGLSPDKKNPWAYLSELVSFEGRDSLLNGKIGCPIRIKGPLTSSASLNAKWTAFSVEKRWVPAILISFDKYLVNAPGGFFDLSTPMSRRFCEDFMLSLFAEERVIYVRCQYNDVQVLRG